MVIRTLKQEDSPRLLSLFLDLTSNPINFQIEAVLTDPNCHAIVLEDDGELVGFAALIMYQVPTKGRVGKIEDVVVAKAFQGQGLGGTLMDELIEVARKKGLQNITLTSNPKREPARKLYLKKGFQLLETGVFLLRLK